MERANEYWSEPSQAGRPFEAPRGDEQYWTERNALVDAVKAAGARLFPAASQEASRDLKAALAALWAFDAGQGSPANRRPLAAAVVAADRKVHQHRAPADPRAQADYDSAIVALEAFDARHGGTPIL